MPRTKSYHPARVSRFLRLRERHLECLRERKIKSVDSRSYERVSGRVAEHSHAAGERRGIEPQAGILIRQFSRFARPKMYITPSMAMRLSSISSTIGNRPCFVPDQEIGQLALVHLSLIVPKPHCPCGSPGPCSIVRVVTPNQLAICPDFAEPFHNLSNHFKIGEPAH